MRNRKEKERKEKEEKRNRKTKEFKPFGGIILTSPICSKSIVLSIY